MAQFQQWFNQDFTEDIEIRHCESVMFTGDNQGAVVGVRLFTDGAAYSGGGTVTGAVKRRDGGLVALTGTLSGNAASVVIPAAALAYPGPIGVHIILTQGGSTTTVLKAIYSVDDSSGTAVDPGTIIPSINDLITAINTAVASIPSDYSALLHTLAPDFSTSTAYNAGDYVWYNGTLYRFTANHAAGTWTGTDAVNTVVCNDIGDLKNSLNSNLVGCMVQYQGANPTISSYYVVGGSTYRVKKEGPSTGATIAVSGNPSAGNAQTLKTEYQDWTPKDSGYACFYKDSGTGTGLVFRIEGVIDTIDESINNAIGNLNGNLFHSKDFCEDASAYYDTDGFKFSFIAQDGRNIANIPKNIKLLAGVEYVFALEGGYENAFTFYLYNSSNQQEFSAAINASNAPVKFTVSADGYYCIKLYNAASAAYPFNVYGIYLGAYSDWEEYTKDGFVVRKTADNDDVSINRTIAAAYATGVNKVIIPAIYARAPRTVSRSSYDYVIHAPIIVYAYTELCVDPMACIKLADNANCPMLTNAHNSSSSLYDWGISISGGKWYGNFANQEKFIPSKPTTPVNGMVFLGVYGLRIKNVEIVGARVYQVLLGNVYNVEVDGCSFEAQNLTTNDNQDGLHLLGPAINVSIQNTNFISEDNVIAINADDSNHGDYSMSGNIDKVYINNIFINNQYGIGGQGMLLLAAQHKISNVHVSNVFGVARYLVNLSNFDLGNSGQYENIVFSNIFLKSLRSWTGYITITGASFKHLSFSNIFIEKFDTSRHDENCLIKIHNQYNNGTTVSDINIDNVKIIGENAAGLSKENNALLRIGSGANVEQVSIRNVKSAENTIPVVPIAVEGGNVDRVTLSESEYEDATFGYAIIDGVAMEQLRIANVDLVGNSNNIITFRNGGSLVKRIVVGSDITT